MTIGFDKWFSLAKNYYNHYGHLDIPINFKTFDGINHDINGYQLGAFISQARQSYKGNGTRRLTDEQILKLESIDMIWNLKELRFITKEINENNIKSIRCELLKRLRILLREIDDNYDYKELNKEFTKRIG